MGKKEVKVLILWLSAFIIMLSLLIAFPMLIGYATHEGQQNIVNLTSCQDLTTSDATYYLQNDVSASGTCFNIMADNIILDGQGYIVNYSTAILGHGVNNSEGYDNVTIRNVNIEQNGTLGSWISRAYAIFFNNSLETKIINNTIKINGNRSGIAIYLYNSINSQLVNNLISTTGLGGLNYGILIIGGSNNSVLSNNITTNSTGPSSPGNNGGDNGITLLSSNYNTLSRNIIYADSFGLGGGNNFGIYLDKSNNSIITYNTIHSNGLGYTTSVSIGSGSFNNLLAYNTISANSNSYATAFSVSYVSYSNITSNNFSASSETGARGIYLGPSLNSVFDSNNLFISGKSNNAVPSAGLIILGGTSNNTFDANNIFINDAGSAGNNNAILFYSAGGSSQNVFANNNLSIVGPRSSGFAFTQNGGIFNNNFTNNNFLNTFSYDVKADKTSGINGTYFIDQQIKNYSINGSGSLINFKNTQFGEIVFLQPINGSGSDLSSEIKISNNLAFINESNEGLNKSAKISLYNIPTSIANASILRNGILCNANSSPSCYNLTAFDAGTVIFNVTRGGSYNIKYDLVDSPQRIISGNNDNKTSGVSNTYEISEEDAVRGVTSSIGPLDKIIIKSGNERYELRVQIINNVSIYLQMANNPTRILLVIGDITNIDVNNDGVVDYEITLLSIENDKPSLFIKKTLVETFDAKEEASLTTGGDEGAEQKKESASVNKGKIIYYFVIALLSIGIAVVVFLLIKFYFGEDKNSLT